MHKYFNEENVPQFKDEGVKWERVNDFKYFTDIKSLDNYVHRKIITASQGRFLVTKALLIKIFLFYEKRCDNPSTRKF